MPVLSTKHVPQRSSECRSKPTRNIKTSEQALFFGVFMESEAMREAGVEREIGATEEVKL